MTTQSEKPNILFFFTDDQRFDTINALGNPDIHTPNMDKLVERGTTFTHAHIPGGSSGAVCMPSRAMLHTGRTLYHLQGRGEEIPQDHTTLGEALQQAGYRTFGTGKWHNGTSAYARSFTDGAEIFFGGMNDHWNVPANNFDPTGKYEQQLPVTMNWLYSNKVNITNADHVTPGKHSSELFCDAARDWLANYDSDEPFFMYVSFMAPHDPRTMPKQFLDMYNADDIPLPANFMPEHPFDKGDMRGRDEVLAPFPRTPEIVKQHLAEYYAMITHLDAEMGKVLNELERKGLTENTIIVFAGDNGLALGQHGLFGKQNNYEHSVRVPLVFAGPGIPQNEQRDGFVYLLDIFPTLCDLVNIERPESVEGLSLTPAIRDNNEKMRDSLYLTFTHLQRSVRDRKYKLIENIVEGKRTSQLFDLEEDPIEMNNLIDSPEHAETVTQLREELLRWREEWDDDKPELGQVFWAGYESASA